MAKKDKAQAAHDALVKAEHPTKKVGNKVKIKAPAGKPSAAYKAWRAAKAAKRRPAGVE